MNAADRLANAAEMLLHWTSEPDDPAYRHWLPFSRADLSRELARYRAESPDSVCQHGNGIACMDCQREAEAEDATWD